MLRMTDISRNSTLRNPLVEEDIRKCATEKRRQPHPDDIRAANISCTSSSESSNQSIKEGFFWASLDSTWTVLDQKRLVSMDYLYHRSLEFHNNHHTFRATGDFDYTKQLERMMPDAVACHIMRFDKNSPRSCPQVVASSDLEAVLSNQPIPEGGLAWFHVKDLRAMSTIASALNMHNIAHSHFYDLRVHSAISGLDQDLFVSFCTVLLKGDDAEMHKVYTLSGPNYLVTFERELIMEPDDDDDDVCTANAKSPKKPMLSDLQRQKRRAASGARAEERAVSGASRRSRSTQNSLYQDPTAPPYVPPLAPDGTATDGMDNDAKHFFRSLSLMKDDPATVLDKVAQNITDEIYERVCRLGPFYMMYEIGTEVLATSDTLIEFISRTIFYLKQQVHRRISYRQKLHFHRKIGILSAVLKMCDRLVDEIHENLESVMDKTSSQFQSFNKTLNWEHVMYISCLVDSHVFKSTCIERQRHDVMDMETAMTHVTAIRSEFVSTNLALVGTVFLPMTFLAGVYGMNFQKGADYTDHLLNYEYGPQVFWGMCAFVLFINLYIFTQSGLVTWRNNEGILSTKPPKEDNSSDTDDLSEFDELSERRSSTHGAGSFDQTLSMDYGGRSIKEELRRQRIADLRRASEYTYTSHY